MKIAVLTSGGVDSSVALSLLKSQGFDVTAFYLKIWLEDELSFLGNCPWQEDLSFVKKLCTQLDVELKIINLQKEYFAEVIKLALAQMQEGLTPNPDIFCNSLIKFGTFFKLLPPEFTHIATGHYAKIIQNEEKLFQLQETSDKIKDQTYFLALLTQEQLSRSIFPLGDLTKKEVRDLAEKLNIPSKNRKDSQGLCFLGKINFSDFIYEHLGEKPGEIIEFETGIKQGEHKGLWFHTIGQRKGLGLSGGPWFVVAKDIKSNKLFISKNYYDQSKNRNNFKIVTIHWNSKIPHKNFLQVKLRHGPEKYECKISFTSNDSATIFLLNGARDQGISPGQFAVFYDNNFCLGCGVISEEIF